MRMKNEYRVVLDAVLRLPWGEGLCAKRALEDGMCCALGTTIYGRIPMRMREVHWREGDLSFYNDMDADIFLAISRANDCVEGESPLARKHRMIKWLRERADEEDRSRT